MNLKRFNKEEQEKSEMEKVALQTNGITDKIVEANGEVTVFLAGKIDATNFEEIQSMAFDLLETNNVKSLVYDMNSVSYVSSAGLRMFSAVNQKAVENDVVYRLTNVRESINKLFQLTGYASAFRIEILKE